MKNEKDQKQHEKDVNDPKIQEKKTDPQEDEKEGNVLGDAFDKIFGNKDGEKNISEDEADDPDKQDSIKK